MKSSDLLNKPYFLNIISLPLGTFPCNGFLSPTVLGGYAVHSSSEREIPHPTIKKVFLPSCEMKENAFFTVHPMLDHLKNDLFIHGPLYLASCVSINCEITHPLCSRLSDIRKISLSFKHPNHSSVFSFGVRSTITITVK